ncbi:hypothetical protein N665_1286s0007 [Sinapis alba]|nr:hypothetical protein N665_1286s0007 [Sinapis alba]
MEKQEVSSVHKHPLLPFTRFVFGSCKGCGFYGNIYGGYRCNELGCGDDAVFHKECGEASQEINHPSHLNHPLKLFSHDVEYSCSLCGGWGFPFGYSCSVCDFKLDMVCATQSSPLAILAKPSVHEHPLELCHSSKIVGDDDMCTRDCKLCDHPCNHSRYKYMCVQCKLHIHVECAIFIPEADHTSHPKHSLKFLKSEAAPTHANTTCIICGVNFYEQLHHCDICNFSICRMCMRDPPPLVVVTPTTHEHQLHLFPRHIEFTCNACGTKGDRSPYFCFQCNFVIHGACIDLPRLININRHNHRISYTHRLGHGEWKCKVCRKKVDGFYGAYTCSKCLTFCVHAQCATRKDVWDMVELEGTPEEPEEIAPFKVIDDNTIKHFSHDHNLRINKEGEILQETVLCEACTFQICSEPFYNCEQCSFTLHTKCANLPRKQRHVCDNLPLMLQKTSTVDQTSYCELCHQRFTGFRYANHQMSVDVRCISFPEPFVHASHPHPLYYEKHFKVCSGCEWRKARNLVCDECDFSLCFKCGLLPQKVMRHRYDDHPLSLSYGENSVDSKYWCEACETKLDPEKWFYTCNDCGVVLHISCVVGDFTYITPGPCLFEGRHTEVVSNTSLCRSYCTWCSKRCILPSILKASKDGVVEYFCSYSCFMID